MRKALSFKALPYKAARLSSVSAKAALAAAGALGEIPVIRPTAAVLAMVVGVSVTSVHKAMKASALEREMMIAGGLTLGGINEQLDPSSDDAAAVATTSVEPVPGNGQGVVSWPVRPTVDAMLDAYVKLTPAEQVAFGRCIGIEKVWLPPQRKHRLKPRHNGSGNGINAVA
jgi:hypothetical protein